LLPIRHTAGYFDAGIPVSAKRVLIAGRDWWGNLWAPNVLLLLPIHGPRS
jgi:hypothetical protein